MYKIIIIAIVSLLFSSCIAIKTENSAVNTVTAVSSSKKPLLESSVLTEINSTSNSKQALLLGVSDYYPNSFDLPGIDTDLNLMKKLLTEWGFEVTTLYNSKSLKLEKYLQLYQENLRHNDTFVFYYSGHGSHTHDLNGDEKDGQDETIVLSDGVKNTHYLDDNLHHYFSSIKAKKLILFDSCHSGTAFRVSDIMVPKGLSNKLVNQVFSNELNGTDNIEGEFIALSAAQDDEQSLATKEGSLFTGILVDYLSKKRNTKKSFEEILQHIDYEIAARCRGTHYSAHQPKLSTSPTELNSTSVAKYLGL